MVRLVIEVGDCVKPRSGGPLMAVDAIDGDGAICRRLSSHTRPRPTYIKLTALKFAAFGLMLPSPAPAIVVYTTKAALVYRGCVERVADRDAIVRQELVGAVRDWKRSKYTSLPTGRWRIVFDKRVSKSCPVAPRFLCEGEPPCYYPDNRAPVQIATELVADGSRVVENRGVWTWRAVGAGAN